MCDNETFLCKLKGILKRENDKSNCITGDIVEFSKEELLITSIHKRKNSLLRPLVSNVDYFMITFAAKQPDFDFDRFSLLLVNSFYYNITPVVVINKEELLTISEKVNLISRLSFLKNIGVELFFLSALSETGLDDLKLFLENKVCAFGGPSGAGKSSLINKLQSGEILEIGDISTKTERGKHTTKGASLLMCENGGYIIDTAGFSTIDFPKFDSIQEYIECFPDIDELSEHCGFRDCKHINEPSCKVKEAVANGSFSEERYQLYKKYYVEIEGELKYTAKNKSKYK
jgi:ribosome biogenesis GTPase / thiamine phosphate phosphatase